MKKSEKNTVAAPWELETSKKEAPKTTEAQFWKWLRNQINEKKPSWKLSRIEAWSLPGIPDLLLADSSGRFHLVELKNTSSNTVRLSPHQVSFLSGHNKSLVWLLVRRISATRKPQYYLYKENFYSVSEQGLEIEPFCLSEEIEIILNKIDDANTKNMIESARTEY